MEEVRDKKLCPLWHGVGYVPYCREGECLFWREVPGLVEPTGRYDCILAIMANSLFLMARTAVAQAG